MNTGRKRVCIKRFAEALSVLLLFAGIILSRLYLFDIYKVPSYSMEPTLMAGDYILVTKSEYGPRSSLFKRSVFFTEEQDTLGKNYEKGKLTVIAFKILKKFSYQISDYFA